MNITNNNINKLSVSSLETNKKRNKEVSNYKNQNNLELPNNYIAGLSQINSKVPISYSKIGEIAIPGLKDKAQIFRLANGQRVILASKKGPAFIHTTYNVGSMNEPDNIRGMSHYIEHNLFNGSKNLAPKEYDKKVSELGGDTNASTSFAFTDYHLQLQLLNDNSLEEAIKLNAYQTQFPTFSVEQLIKEKEPVKSEIDMCNDDPNTVAVCKMLKNLFNIKSSSDDFIIGTKSNINSFTRDDVIDYFNTWYTPDNAVTVITGDIDVNETINLVSKYFNKQNDYSNIHKRHYTPIKYNDKPIREDIIKPNCTQPLAVMGFSVKEGTKEQELNKLDVLFGVLCSSDSNLYKELDKLGASIDITVENMQNKPKGAKAVILSINSPEDKLEDAIKTVYYNITKISNQIPQKMEVDNVKKSIINNILASTETSSNLNNILTNSALTDNYDYINSSIKTIQNITPYDVTNTAKKYLDLNKISMCVMHDRNATEETISNQHYKSRQISFGAKTNPVNNIKDETSKIQTITLQNNAEITIISGNPYAKFCICIDFDTDELNKVTHSEFMVLNEMLNRGSSIRGADNFENILNSKDISMSFTSDIDGISIISECNSENIRDTMELIKEKLLYPNLTQDEFIRAKELVKNSILSEKITAFDKLYQEMYPELSKYTDKETKLKELDKINLKDIQKLYSKIISTAQVQALMTAPIENNPELSDIFNKELSTVGIYRPFSYKNGENYNIYKPNIKEKILTTVREQSQAEVVQGYKYKKPKNIDDIAKIKLLNMILGSGGMSSRLFLDLREDKKLAYSVGTRKLNEKDTEVLSLRIGTTTDSIDPNEGSSENILKSLDGFQRNVNLLKTQNVSEKELENAKTICKTRILNKLETNMGKSLNYIDSKYSEYGIQYNEKLFEAIDKVTSDDIKNAANYVFRNPPVISIAASKKTIDELKKSNKI